MGQDLEQENKQPANTAYEGCAKGKYQWDEAGSKKAEDGAFGAKICDYGWADGKKRVSVYVEIKGIDELPDDKLSVTVDENKRKVIFTAGFDSQRVLTLDPLNADVTKAEIKKKPGKIQINIFKEKEEPWYKLIESSSAGGDADDEEGRMGGMGGMGGGMGGMDMESMMAGMGGMDDEGAD